jgi:hypothetical protein
MQTCAGPYLFNVVNGPRMTTEMLFSTNDGWFPHGEGERMRIRHATNDLKAT